MATATFAANAMMTVIQLLPATLCASVSTRPERSAMAVSSPSQVVEPSVGSQVTSIR